MNIRTENLALTIAGHQIFKNVSLTCETGEILALVGPSGSGKTSLLNCLGLLQKPTSGDVHVDGIATNHWKDRDRLRFWSDTASFIYQDYGLIDEESVAYNITLSPPGLLRRKPRITPRIAETLATVGLEGRGLDTVSVLSGGEKQRVGIARTIHKNATCIFADEPTASLDRANRDVVTGLLRDRADAGACVIIATHDEHLANQADRVHTLQ